MGAALLTSLAARLVADTHIRFTSAPLPSHHPAGPPPKAHEHRYSLGAAAKALISVPPCPVQLPLPNRSLCWNGSAGCCRSTRHQPLRPGLWQQALGPCDCAAGPCSGECSRERESARQQATRGEFREPDGQTSGTASLARTAAACPLGWARHGHEHHQNAARGSNTIFPTNFPESGCRSRARPRARR